MTTSTSTEQLISGVDFVALPTHDVRASVEFYGDTLGAQVKLIGFESLPIQTDGASGTNQSMMIGGHSMSSADPPSATMST